MNTILHMEKSIHHAEGQRLLDLADSAEILLDSVLDDQLDKYARELTQIVDSAVRLYRSSYPRSVGGQKKITKHGWLSRGILHKIGKRSDHESKMPSLPELARTFSDRIAAESKPSASAVGPARAPAFCYQLR